MKALAVRGIVVSVAILAISSLSSSAFAGNQVPIKGEFITQFQIVGVEVPEPPAPRLPKVSLIVEGTGQASHLGRSTCLSADETVDFAQGGKLTGKLTFTAANGDTLVARMNATAVPDYLNDTVNFSGTLTFIGGTGRFANATGKASFQGGATPIAGPSGPGWFSFEGTVSSPGASKK